MASSRLVLTTKTAQNSQWPRNQATPVSQPNGPLYAQLRQGAEAYVLTRQQ